MIKQEIIKIKNNSGCKFREFVINLILKEDSPLDCLLDLKKYGVQNYGFSNLIYNQDILKVFEKYQCKALANCLKTFIGLRFFSRPLACKFFFEICSFNFLNLYEK